MDAIEIMVREIQARRAFPREYDGDITRAMETMMSDNLRLTEEWLSMSADRQIERDEATIAQSKLVGEIERLREQLGKARNIELLRVAIADGYNNGYEQYEDCTAMLQMRFDAAARAVAALTDEKGE